MSPVRLHLTYSLWLTSEGQCLFQSLHDLPKLYGGLTG